MASPTPSIMTVAFSSWKTETPSRAPTPTVSPTLTLSVPSFVGEACVWNFETERYRVLRVPIYGDKNRRSRPPVKEPR
jgi:hypothetical protein